MIIDYSMHSIWYLWGEGKGKGETCFLPGRILLAIVHIAKPKHFIPFSVHIEWIFVFTLWLSFKIFISASVEEPLFVNFNEVMKRSEIIYRYKYRYLNILFIYEKAY